MTSRPFHSHSVYGLTVESWIPFPELESARIGAPTDVVFRLGEVPAELPDCRKRGARFQAEPGRLLVWLDNVARFLSVGGREILVQPAGGAIESDLRLFLLCSPMGAILLQRGLLPLHASAIATSSGAVVFMGPPGAGKSTMAACFRKRGLRVLSDDIAVIRFDGDGRAWVEPGFPQFKLWPDAVEKLGEDGSNLPKLRPRLEKRAVSFRNAYHAQPLPLARIYVLNFRASKNVEFASLSAPEKLAAIVENTYRAHFVPGLGLAASHFQAASRVAGGVPMARIWRSKEGGPEAVADRLEADFQP